jgi:hypothetical protein
MKVLAAAVMLSTCMAACAHTEAPKDPPPVQAGSEASAAPATVPASLQVSLPYRFSRRGVEIRVNFVEFANGRLEVSVQLQETRKENGELLASTLMQARTPSGETLPFAGYSRGGQVLQDPAVRLAPDERILLSLFFQLPAAPAAPRTPVELQFPTGKWWSSR